MNKRKKNLRPIFKSSPNKASNAKKTGERNLLILGLSATLITIITTAISLFVYHDSGDIYLDRSRPGFLPETEEVEQEKTDTDYSLSDSGKITKEVLEEYLDNLTRELDRLNDFSSDPFSTVPLSDDSLGI